MRPNFSAWWRGVCRTWRYYMPIALLAMGLAWVSEQAASFLGYDLPPQDLVKLLQSPNASWALKFKWGAIAVLVCPPIEEVLFRGLLFGGLERLCRKTRAHFQIAALISGAIFAALHFHVATFVPLWFLGVAFAWVYRKGETLAASTACHVFFNLLNFTLCLCVPMD